MTEIQTHNHYSDTCLSSLMPWNSCAWISVTCGIWKSKFQTHLCLNDIFTHLRVWISDTSIYSVYYFCWAHRFLTHYLILLFTSMPLTWSSFLDSIKEIIAIKIFSVQLWEHHHNCAWIIEFSRCVWLGIFWDGYLLEYA